MDSLQTTLKKPRTGWLLAGLYCCCVLIRFLLAWLTSAYPTVRIDEYLYASLGRSIATEGSLLYLGQPALYNYLVYPLVLSPIYALFPAGTDYYRLIQGWNILLMSLSVFPVYGLCRGVLGDREKAFWVTALFMLLPDYILGQGIFSEAVIYPLFFTLMYCAYKNLRSPRLLCALAMGALGGLLYCVKPGSAIPAVLTLLLTAGKAIRTRSGKTGLCAGLGVCAFASVILFFMGLARHAFGYVGASFSVYETQLTYDAGKNLDIFVRTAVLYPYYFLLGCGILPLLYALQRLPHFRAHDRRFLLLTLVSALTVMTGTAFTVNRPEGTCILFLRYADMYLPLVLLFSVLPTEETPPALDAGKRQNVSLPCLCLLAYAAVCTLLAGADAGIGKPLDVHFLFSLAVLFVKNSAFVAGAVVLLLCAGSLYLLRRRPDHAWMARACCFLFLGVEVLSNYAGYAVTASNTFKSLAAEARETLGILQDREHLYVYAASRCDYGLDVNSRTNASQITFSDFANDLRENHGVYVPFVPASSRGMTACRLTADADALILNWKTYPLIQFVPSVSPAFSADKTYMAVTFDRGRPLADAVITGTEELTLNPDEDAELLLLNGAWLGKPLRIELEIESKTAQSLILTGDVTEERGLTEGRNRCEFVLDAAEESCRLTPSAESVSLISFHVSPAE